MFSKQCHLAEELQRIEATANLFISSQDGFQNNWPLQLCFSYKTSCRKLLYFLAFFLAGWAFTVGSVGLLALFLGAAFGCRMASVLDFA